MSAEILNLRDFQSKAAIERAHKALEEHLNREAIEIANMCFPGGIDSIPFVGPDADPA